MVRTGSGATGRGCPRRRGLDGEPGSAVVGDGEPVGSDVVGRQVEPHPADRVGRPAGRPGRDGHGHPLQPGPRCRPGAVHQPVELGSGIGVGPVGLKGDLGERLAGELGERRVLGPLAAAGLGVRRQVSGDDDRGPAGRQGVWPADRHVGRGQQVGEPVGELAGGGQGVAGRLRLADQQAAGAGGEPVVGGVAEGHRGPSFRPAQGLSAELNRSRRPSQVAAMRFTPPGLRTSLPRLPSEMQWLKSFQVANCTRRCCVSLP